MRIATNADLQMSTNTMHRHVASLATLKTMMHMLFDELDRGAKSVYLDVMEARVIFQRDVTTNYANTITEYQAWH